MNKLPMKTSIETILWFMYGEKHSIETEASYTWIKMEKWFEMRNSEVGF